MKADTSPGKDHAVYMHRKVKMENNERDIYYCQLPMVKMLCNRWAEAHPTRRKQNSAVGVTLILGAAIILGMLYYTIKHANAPQWYLHVSIWVAALIIFMAGRQRNLISNPPFKGLLNVRYEMSDEGIYYIYQEKLTVYTFFIADDDIEEMIYDDEFQVLHIIGKGEVSSETRKGVTEPTSVNDYYCLLPYDEFDIDDILNPYGDMIKRVHGDLRRDYRSK